MLLMTLNILVFAVLSLFLISTIKQVEQDSQQVVDAHMSDLLLSSQITSQLSQVFSGIEVLRTSFLDRNSFLTGEALKLNTQLAQIGQLNEQLRPPLQALKIRFDYFVAQCKKVNTYSALVSESDNAINLKLNELDTLISDWLVQLTLSGEATDYIDQVLVLTTGYRESLLHISRLHAEHKYGHLNQEKTNVRQHDSINKNLKDLILRLQTLTASEPQIATFGIQLIELVNNYKINLEQLEHALYELKEAQTQMNAEQNNLLGQIKSLQDQSAEEANALTDGISKVINSLGNQITLGTIIAVVVMTLLTNSIIRKNIKQPLSGLINGIERMQEGEKIGTNLQRDDEWQKIANALTDMQYELDIYYQKVQENEKKYRALIENQSDMVVEVDTRNRFLYVSPTYCETFGKTEDELLGKTFMPLVHEDDRSSTEQAMEELFEPPYQCHIVQRAMTKQGWRWLSWNDRAVLDTEGKVSSIIGVGRDINDIINAQEQLSRQKVFLNTVINAVADPILVIGTDYNIQLYNEAADRAYGLDRHSINGILYGRTCHETIHGLDKPCNEQHDHPCPLKMVLDTGKNASVIHRHRTSLGEERFYDITASPYHDEHGNIIGIVEVSHDITEKLKSDRKIKFLAQHDALTKLPNRLLLQDRVSQAIYLAERSEHKIALLFLDLDHFKDVNDSLGHHIGDKLLKAVVKRISKKVRESDTISRQGGDEFIILMPELNSSNATEVVAQHILDALARPFDIEEHHLIMSASLGIAIYPDNGSDFDTLLKNADTAMYAAKEAGRNTYRFFTEQTNLAIQNKLNTKKALLQALENNELEVYYQPQVELVSGKLSGVEALVRWNTPENKILKPNEFIPIAEETGLIVKIGEWVLSEACRQITKWKDELGISVPVSVNVSSLQLKHSDLYDTIKRVIHQHHTPPNLIELELTESILLQDSDKIFSSLKNIKQLGIKLAIDDFGTGYSSLSYLSLFKLDRLKIDQSFVNKVPRDSEYTAIVHAIIQMAHSLNLEIVVEGVETEEQFSWLASEGCEYVQGFYFYEPLKASMCTEVLSRSLETTDTPVSVS